MIIRARAPLRLGLSGGGTDVSPYCDLHGGYVLNATIDRYAYATIQTTNESKIHFYATDQNIQEIEPLNPICVLNGKLNLHKSVYNTMIHKYNADKAIPLILTTFCDAPIGSGLGASSALVVVMIRAFVELLNLPLDDYTIAGLAFYIERVECQLQGGRQDQYSATFGGFNFIEFYADNRIIVNPLRIKNNIICELEASLLLFYTGISRQSLEIIVDQINNVQIGTIKAINALHAIKSEALIMKECLLKGDFEGMITSMHLSWENKKNTSHIVSNTQIDKIYNAAMQSGAFAGKISGAGGGGFIIFFVSPNKRMDVVRTLQQFDGQVSNCHFTKYGTQAWRI